MLVLQCTRKVAKRFKIKLEPLPENLYQTHLGVWYVNYAKILRYKFLIFMNDPTLYSLPVYIRKVSDVKDMGELFKENLLYALLNEGIDERLVRAKLREYDPVVYTKTSSRRILGHMNDIILNLESYIELEIYMTQGYMDILQIVQHVQKKLNRIPQRALNWGFAADAIKESLERSES